MSTRDGARRERLTLGFGLLIVGLLVAMTRLWPRWRSFELAEADRATSMANDITAAASARRVLPALRDSLEARRELRRSLDSSLIHAASAAIAAAEAASIVQALAGDAGMSVSSQSIGADSGAAGGLRRVTVRLVASGAIHELAAFLRAVTSGSRLLSVREIAIAQADPTAASTGQEVLRVDVSVDALCVVDSPAGR